jgi:hypothetical protein
MTAVIVDAFTALKARMFGSDNTLEKWMLHSALCSLAVTHR